ncbi:MAG: hypothetical protein ACR2IA_04415 [Pyrinomonadaceae bacterium]
MHKRQLTIVGIILIAAGILLAITTYRQQAQDKSSNQQNSVSQKLADSDLSELPIVDFSQSKLEGENSERKEKNKRFNYPGVPNSKKTITELPGGAANILTISHWWVGLSALPVETTDAIVIGTVTNKAAYLADDKTNIYSEYEIKIEKILKDLSESLKSNDVVTLVRYGGSVRFNSGKIQKYKINGYGTLKENHRYLMFLKKVNGVDLFLVTGYELSGNKVIPIDGQDDKDPRSALPFDKYLNADVDALLKDIQIALETNRNKGGTE